MTIYATLSLMVEPRSRNDATWTAQLMGNAKERCLVSCIATERLTGLVDHPEADQ